MPDRSRPPMRNRVTPMGDIVASELRGAWTGNRGILHRGTDIVRFHAGDLWIICVLEYKDWRLPQWADGHFTVLFFHDEALAMAAGHRPCGLCRRASYNAYRDAWVDGNKTSTRPSAKELDRQLHDERIVRGTHRRRIHAASWTSLPTGAFIVLADRPALVVEDSVLPWTTQGYGPARRRPTHGSIDVITPPSSLAAIRSGYRPQIDSTATSAASAAG